MAPKVVSVPLAKTRASQPGAAPMPQPSKGNRKPASTKKPYISPEATAAPTAAPTIPFAWLYSPAALAMGLAGRSGALEMGGGAATATGAVPGVINGGGGSFSNSALAGPVPSTPQTGHATVKGIWPFTGSTSN